MPHKAQPKAKAAKTASVDIVPPQPCASASVGALPRVHPQPQLITASTTTQTTEVSTEKNTQLRSTDSAPPPCCEQCMCKATVLPDASEYPQEKKFSQKALAAQTNHEKELKEERMQKSIKSLAAYEKKNQDYGIRIHLNPSAASWYHFKS